MEVGFSYRLIRFRKSHPKRDDTETDRLLNLFLVTARCPEILTPAELFIPGIAPLIGDAQSRHHRNASNAEQEVIPDIWLV